MKNTYVTEALHRIEESLVRMGAIKRRPYSMTIPEGAAYTGASERKIWSAVASGELTAYKPTTMENGEKRGKRVLVKTDDLEKWVDAGDMGIPKV